MEIPGPLTPSMRNKIIFLITFTILGFISSGCSCDSVKGGFIIITQSLPDGEVGKPYSTLLEARWFIFGIMNTNPPGNTYTISAPDASAFIAGEEYVLFGMVAKTGPPNLSAENNLKISIGGTTINKDLIFLSPPTLVSPVNSASLNRVPTFSFEATEGAGEYNGLQEGSFFRIFF